MGFFDKIKKTIRSDDKTTSNNLESVEEKGANPNDILSKSDSNNFKYLDELIHSDKTEIILESDIILQDNESSKYEEGINLDEINIIIDGKDHVIDAKSKVPFLNINGGKITFKNITFKNGFHEHFSYHDNYIDGGAINNEGADLIFENCNFFNNQKKGPSGAAGAIYNGQGSMLFKNCKFIENSSTYHGGAIYNNTESTLTIENSLFENNHIDEGVGGAIYNSKGTVKITDTIFRNNSVLDGEGGAIYNTNELAHKKHELKLTRCTFENNSVKSSGSYFEGCGGAIYNKSILFLSECTFKNNFAFIGSSIFNYNNKINLIKSKFENNKSKYGADIYQHLEDCSLTIEGCDFSQELTDENFIYNSRGFCLVKNSQFKSNNVDNKGHAIYNRASMTIEKSKFHDDNNNKTIFNDKFLKISKNNNIEDEIEYGENAESLKYLHTALDEDSKGFDYLDDLLQDDSNEIFLEYDILMEYEERNFYEGGILLNIDDLTIDGQGHKIDANNLSRIFYISAKNVTLKNIKFINGKYTKNPLDIRTDGGGAICILHESTVNIVNCEFMENSSRESAGAIYNGGRLITIDNCRFHGNNSNYDGGAIFSELGAINIINSEFNDNESSGNGGAIYIKDGDFKSEDCNFNNNSARVEGGAISAKNGCLDIINCSFDKNTSNEGVGGGAIFNHDATLKFTGCMFENNYGCYGGAINNGGGFIKINQCNFGDNYAIAKFKTSFYQSVGEGGSINNKGTIKLSDSTFNGKEGDILSNGGNIEISGCVFKSYHSIKNEGKMTEGERNIIK